MTTESFARFAMTAALAVASAVASFASDGGHLKAKIDFPFKAFTSDMAAGHYDILQKTGDGNRYFYLRNVETGKQIVLLGHASEYSKSTRPSLTFHCVSAGCGLTGISSDDGQTYSTASPKWRTAEKERLVTVYLDRVAGE